MRKLGILVVLMTSCTWQSPEEDMTTAEVNALLAPPPPDHGGGHCFKAQGCLTNDEGPENWQKKPNTDPCHSDPVTGEPSTLAQCTPGYTLQQASSASVVQTQAQWPGGNSYVISHCSEAGEGSFYCIVIVDIGNLRLSVVCIADYDGITCQTSSEPVPVTNTDPCTSDPVIGGPDVNAACRRPYSPDPALEGATRTTAANNGAVNVNAITLDCFGGVSGQAFCSLSIDLPSCHLVVNCTKYGDGQIDCQVSCT